MGNPRWFYESDGDGSPKDRGDHYIVSADGLERIATFHGADARANAHRTIRMQRKLEVIREICEDGEQSGADRLDEILQMIGKDFS